MNREPDMKQLVILSGKGGTGKTTVAAALAHLAFRDSAPKAHRLVIADVDVDAANLGLVLAPCTEAVHDFIGGAAAAIDPALCRACGRCSEVCRFEAIREGDAYAVDPIACEGCGACVYECPTGAIAMQPQHAGQWFEATTRFGPLYYAHLFAGQENSGKLVTLVKQMARLRAFDVDRAGQGVRARPVPAGDVVDGCLGRDLPAEGLMGFEHDGVARLDAQAWFERVVPACMRLGVV